MREPAGLLRTSRHPRVGPDSLATGDVVDRMFWFSIQKGAALDVSRLVACRCFRPSCRSCTFSRICQEEATSDPITD